MKITNLLNETFTFNTIRLNALEVKTKIKNWVLYLLSDEEDTNDIEILSF